MQQRVHKIGLDANQPIDAQGNIAARLRDPEIIASANASWLRINFVLERRYDSPTDKKWLETYDKIIDQYLAKGMNIYGLIGHEAVRSRLGLPDFFRDPRSATRDNRAEQWINEYVENFATIVKHFYPRIKVFESFNEPDDWSGGNRNWIHSSWFAVMLTRIYDRIKVEERLTKVTLVSGPLQGLSLNNNGAVSYLTDTYSYGTNTLGWGKAGRPYPFDGIGYHIYIHESYNPNWQQHERAVRQTYGEFTGAIKRVIKRFEGQDRHLYISETGWPSARDNREDKKFQARHATLILKLMNDDPSVALGIWFCTEDFMPPVKFYGLYERNSPTQQGRKPAYFTYQEFCANLLKQEEQKKQEKLRLEKEKEEKEMASMREQIAELQNKLEVLYQEANRPAPTLNGTLREQIDQLRQQIIGLRADFAAPLNGVANDSLIEQLTTFEEYIAKIPTPTGPGSGITPPSGQDDVLQQLAQLRSQVTDIERRLADSSTQPSPTTQFDTLNTRITTLQQYIQQLVTTQAQIQNDLQALQAQVNNLGTITPPPQKQITPPPIQDITAQLPRNPTKQFEQRSIDQIRHIIIQHTGNDANIGAMPIANYLVNRENNPLAGIIYHYFITGEAAIEQTNELTTVTNLTTVLTIGFAGKFMSSVPTPQQIQAGAELIAWLLSYLNLTIDAVRGAKEVSNSASPGDTWDAGPRWGEQLRSQIRAILQD